MRILHHLGGTATVRGGGLSSTCVADDAVMLDLSVHLNAVRPHETTVTVDGGATVGPVLEALAPARRVIPVGIVGLAGLGLVTRGGVGYLTRSVGLALDHLVEVELVLPDGEIVRLSDDSQGEEAELWWAVRGCAPCFGIVTSAVLRTIEQDGLCRSARRRTRRAARILRDRPRAAAPHHDGGGAGVCTRRAGRPRATGVYGVPQPERRGHRHRAGGGHGGRCRCEGIAAVPVRGCRPVSEWASRVRHTRFERPRAEPIRAPEPGEHRGWFYGKSVFTGPTLGDDVASGLQEAIRAAPTPACRIDFQRTGGALADIGDTATAFWGRGGEWNIPLNAIWSDAADGDGLLRLGARHPQGAR